MLADKADVPATNFFTRRYRRTGLKPIVSKATLPVRISWLL